MTLAALLFCTASIYVSFLLWALLQERLTTTPYDLPLSLLHPTSSSRHEYFKSPLVLNSLQAILCTVVAATYILVQSRKSREPMLSKLGLDTLTPSGCQRAKKTVSSRGAANGELKTTEKKNQRKQSISPLLLRYIQISASQSISSLLALHSLSHGISYPTLTLAKSCKLVPVLFANVILYQRRFAAYKYVVVLLVTIGISTFMLFGDSKKGKANQESSMVGLLLLLGNQALDGMTNSTQDEVFSQYTLSGPKMMLVMNGMSSLLMVSSLLLPLPVILGGSSGSGAGKGELKMALEFIHRHPEILRDLLGYALAGAVGQIAIFETLERFGSLTLVAITVSVSAAFKGVMLEMLTRSTTPFSRSLESSLPCFFRLLCTSIHCGQHNGGVLPSYLWVWV
jgi:UDP-galactose transporter B1